MSIVEIKDLQKKFGNFSALKKVNLTLEKGEIFGFIGPNGAGKTTTIRILLGIIKATSGSAKIFDRLVWEDAVVIHKRISYIPGDVNLWPNLTGQEVINLFTSLQGSPVNREKLSSLISAFDLDINKKCRTYSKGNRQKVALIASLASDADLYIFDEPTSGLDPLMEQVFQKYILEKKKEGKTILLSSHILSEVERLCDRIGIIREGEIVEIGTLKELRHLTRLNIIVETENPINDLSKIVGVHDVVANESCYSFQADTDKIGSIISTLATYGVIRLESSPTTLEDLFMRHYARNGE